MIYKKQKVPKIHKKKKKQTQKKEKYEHNIPPPPLRDITLQQILGNQEVQRMFQASEIMAKLFISQPGDIYEKEADRIAKRIVIMGDKEVQLKTSEIKIQKKGASLGGESVSPQTEAGISSLKGKGQPLEPKIRDYFQPRFGVDLKDVRVHTDSNADRLARAIRAKAFTLGNDVVFAKGEYKPGTKEGKKLVAHELTHVLQQGKGIALTPVSERVKPYLYTSILDWFVDANDERDILRLLRADSNISATIIDLDRDNMLDKLINDVDESANRRELLQILGAKLNSTARGLVEPFIIRLGIEWELQYNLGRLGVTFAAPYFNPSAYSHLISITPTDPFTGLGATGISPTKLGISIGEQILLAIGDATTTARYSNPLVGLRIYLTALTATERTQQVELLLNLPICSVEDSSFATNLPSRKQVIIAAATAHNLHPEMLAAFLLAEQRDQSKNEDAADYTGATSIAQGNTSIGLGQVLISTAIRHDLFADLLSYGTRSSLSHNEIARLLASDEFNIFAAARYIRIVANAGSVISISTLPNTQSTFPNINMAAYANNSSTWPADNIRALASEYTSRAWDDRLSQGWAWFVFEAYKDVINSGVFP